MRFTFSIAIFLPIFTFFSCSQPVSETSAFEEKNKEAPSVDVTKQKEEQFKETDNEPEREGLPETFNLEDLYARVFREKPATEFYGTLVPVPGKKASLITAEKKGPFPPFIYQTEKDAVVIKKQTFRVQNPLNSEETQVYTLTTGQRAFLILEGPGKKTNRERSKIRYFEIFEYTGNIQHFSLQSNFGSFRNFGYINQDDTLDFLQIAYHPEPELFGALPEIHTLRYYTFGRKEIKQLYRQQEAVLQYVPVEERFKIIEPGKILD